ncbi:MAG TPA: hypothetical protein VIC27_12870 [Ktedonobacterales bacterium]|jgi:hypothetical protein
MTREQFLQAFADAYERLIATAVAAAQRGVTRQGDSWGPREIVAHLAGWEVMATVRVPPIAAGMLPLEEADESRQTVMTDAINATIVTMIGAQSLDALCGLLREAYHRDLAILRTLDDANFHPGAYVFERTQGAIEHCQEHAQALVIADARGGAAG